MHVGGWLNMYVIIFLRQHGVFSWVTDRAVFFKRKSNQNTKLGRLWEAFLFQGCKALSSLTPPSNRQSNASISLRLLQGIPTFQNANNCKDSDRGMALKYQLSEILPIWQNLLTAWTHELMHSQNLTGCVQTKTPHDGAMTLFRMWKFWSTLQNFPHSKPWRNQSHQHKAG